MAPWLAEQPKTIVVQPTTLCPMDCTYCYLLERHLKQEMTPQVATAIADGIAASWEPVEVVWHGGEPLAVGLERFVELLQPFEPLRLAGRVRHKVQTGGGRPITDAWCDVFERCEIGVGVSIDGPRELNHHRVDRGGRPMFDRTMAGIETLKRRGIPFTVLAVVSQNSTGQAVQVLDFMRELGTSWVGFNVEAKEGANSDGQTPSIDHARRFWRDTFEWCRRNTDVTVREVSNLFGFLGLTQEQRDADSRHDPIPTIAWNGDVVLLSPELLGVRSTTYDDFIAGNVLQDGLSTIVQRAAELLYVREFTAALATCKQTCEFFSFCQGAHAGDRFFEHGTFAATETDHCRNTVQAPVLALAELLHGKGSR
ncbi:cyclophane-forming radical SAM peptide maturase AmcB [Lentzea sp. DG1S-22]|uniref:cyclophane-forming radical SAM peptide maturase AmcB n=1 Tax=Lentzea sp. DG1S-22 TaxID=3108822 RepID=UPI002E7AA753|nr:cyclophane-forming radical SAM peptide maturase AmcB [Lentzea sp. DG1S-22]WVH82753.1 cyclophane-forming radical SAM peptide maturase AmcB [Lentzea sp. DG1S-22]